MAYVVTTWAYREVVTSAKLNQMSANDDYLKAAIDGTWTAYTPVLTATTTNPSLGSGGNFAQDGRYKVIGKLVTCQFTLRWGSTGPTAGSGSYRISLPVAALTKPSLQITGSALAFDASGGAAGWYNAALEVISSTTVGLIITPGGRATDLIPFVWASSDLIAGTFQYEAA